MTAKPTEKYLQRLWVEHIEQKAMQLVRDAHEAGLVLTISNEPTKPLRMGGFLPVVEVRLARGQY